MNLRHFIGIDIGKKGGIAVMYPNGRFVARKMPMIKTSVDWNSVNDILKQFVGAKAHVGMEKLQGIFGTSKRSTFSLAEQFGHIQGMCIALGIPFTIIPPKKWQAEMLDGANVVKKPSSTRKTMVNDTKAMALQVFRRMYPAYKTIHNGIIDAVLIAEYMRRKF